MKKFSIYLIGALFLFAQKVESQCIKDIQNLVSQPEPCFFIGFIDFDNLECFDVFGGSEWSYTWKIRSASDDKLIATYNGMAFQHTFKQFGGYKFCLEIEKDGNPTNGPELTDCVSYTTCQICSEDEIKMEYLSCPYGEGCHISLSAKIPSENDFGLESTAKFIMTYLPTPQEILGGAESYDIVFDDFPLDYNPVTDSIQVAQNVTLPFKRGCFKPRVVMKIKDGFGSHDMDGVACEKIELRSEEKIRCIACGNKDGECIASEVASAISNEEDSCDPFYFCNQFRESGDSALETIAKTSIAASPNPADNIVHIEFPATNTNYRMIIILNQIGQTVMKKTVDAEQSSTDFEIGNLMPGLYFATLVENGKIESSTQILIQR